MPAIEYLIVVATTSEISILGLLKRKRQGSFKSFETSVDSSSTRAASPLSKYTLIDTKLGISSEGIAMLSIVGTPEGLVFMGGNDGNIYQLDYEGDNGSWFSWSSGRKCKKINQTSSVFSSLIPTIFRFGSIDPIVNLKTDYTRSLLYAISNSGIVDIFSFNREVIASQGSRIERLAKVQNVYDDFLKICPQSLIYKKRDFDIVDLHPITINQSPNVYFIISTTVGIRIWYALAIQPPSPVPSTFKMITIPLHARLLPQDPSEGLSISTKNTATHCSFYNRGVFLSAQAKTQTEDVIFNTITESYGCDKFEQVSKTPSLDICERPKAIVSQASSEFQGRYLSIIGKIWAIAEAPHSLTFDILDNPPDFEEDAWLNRLSILHELLDAQSFPLRQFLVLANTGFLFVIYSFRHYGLDEIKTVRETFSKNGISFIEFSASSNHSRRRQYFFIITNSCSLSK